MVFGYLVHLVALSDRDLHLMTSNPEYIPTCWYYTKSLPQILILHIIVDCGLWLTMNVVIWSIGRVLHSAVLMSAVSGCKLAKLGWNNIEHQNTFFQYFFPFLPNFWWPLNTENYTCILALTYRQENRIPLLIHEKWFLTLVDNFKLCIRIL